MALLRHGKGRERRPLEQDARVEIHMRKSVTTKALYAGSFDPVTRGHLDIIGKALLTFDTVHVAVGTNVKKVRMFGVEESQRLIVRSIMERWPEEAPTSTDTLFEGALEVGEFTNKSLIAYARIIPPPHIVRALLDPSTFNHTFNFTPAPEPINPHI